MRVSLSLKDFEKKMNNFLDYSVGFLDGAQKGKKIFLNKFGKGLIEAISQYIDVNARMNPEALHHVYEWYETGSPAARLFDIDYVVSGSGLSMNATFRQSNTLSKDNTEPFYNKARIMESGVPVSIAPKKSNVLVFESGGETVFTKKKVDIKYPGGPEVVGSFEKTFDTFFKYYFSQSFLRASGILDYLESPKVFKANASKGAVLGKNYGIKTGYTWIINAKLEVE